MQTPGRKLFEPYEIRRLPVTMDKATETAIMASSWEGRHLPLAIGEAFGTIAEVEAVTITMVPKQQHFTLAPDEDTNTMLLEILAHCNDREEPYRFLINLSDLSEQHPSGLFGFNAALTAAELARLIRHQKGME